MMSRLRRLGFSRRKTVNEGEREPSTVRPESASSVTGIIQAFDDYDDESRTYMMAVCISEDDLKDWMHDGAKIRLSPNKW